MKAYLLYADQDFSWTRPSTFTDDDLIKDLGADFVVSAMANGNQHLYDVAQRVLLFSLRDAAAIRYRQQILEDCLHYPDVVRDLYRIAIQTLSREKRIWHGWGDSPSSLLHGFIERLQLFVEQLRSLRRLADERGPDFGSVGMVRFFSMLIKELDDEYFARIDDHLQRLRFKAGVSMSVQIDAGAKGRDFVLRMPSDAHRGWKERFGMAPRTSYSFDVHPRDEAGHRALQALTDQGLNEVANALGKSTDHIFNFFKCLASESAFYVGCLNLRETLTARRGPLSIPRCVPWEAQRLEFVDLYDVGLALRSNEEVVANTGIADNKNLLFVTGANSGGKSTFLRSLGLAYLMAQCGMFVAAASFDVSVCSGIFTHFIREEDTSMESGRLDDELSRMSSIADELEPRTLVLFNESFAGTNEREGSEIGRQIVRALLKADIHVVFVTHLFELAQGFFLDALETTMFLRAERLPDGRRTYKVVEGEPLESSFGQDLYLRLQTLRNKHSSQRSAS